MNYAHRILVLGPEDLSCERDKRPPIHSVSSLEGNLSYQLFKRYTEPLWHCACAVLYVDEHGYSVIKNRYLRGHTLPYTART